MNKTRKIIVLAATMPFLVMFLYLVFFKFFVILSFPEKELKIFITKFFMQNFNRAVKFENVYIDVFGNLVITNFEISITSDFNDNINLIRSQKTTIGLEFCKIIKKRIIVNNIKFDNSDITLFKKYGKGFLENFKEIFILNIDISRMNRIDLNNFSIEINDSNLYYKEIFQEDKLTVFFEDVNSRIDITKTNLSYYLKGTIRPYKSREIGSGNFFLRGEYLFKGNNEFYLSNSSVVIDDFDLSYFNSYIPIHFKKSFLMHGGISTALTIKTVNENISIDGKIDFNNLNLELGGNSSSYNILSNENFSLRIVCDILNNFNRIILRKFDISDENIRLCMDGIYNKNKLERYIDIGFKSNKIDLSELSNYLTPMENITYSGYLNINGRIDYDLRNNISKNTSISIFVDNLVLTDYIKGRKNCVLTDLDLSLKLNRGELIIDISAKKNNSDIKIKSNSRIYNWNPFKSETNIFVYSDILESRLIFHMFRILLDHIYLNAYQDKNRGYEEILFTQTPIGKLINNNNLDLKLKANRFLFGKRAYLSNLNVAASLRDGRFKLQNFELAGYDGIYTCEATSYFNSDYPRIEISGGVNSFNIERFSRDLGIDGELSGVLYIDFNFQTTAYRLSHIVENTRGKLYVEIRSGLLDSTNLQDKLILFLRERGYLLKDIRSLKFSRASVSLVQTGGNFYIRNFSFNGDNINFSTYGKYNFSNGLKVPFMAVIKEKDENNIQKTINIPLSIKGTLLKPELIINRSIKKRRGKDTPSLFLYNISR